MLKKKSKNGGMTLVEVIVSMLVLSIAVVTVMTTFSMASKTNNGTKQKQSVESLMENLLEYAQAGGSDYKGWFHVDTANHVVDTPYGPTSTKQVERLLHVPQGYFEYNVRITTDYAPTEYESAYLNDRGIIQFGGSGSNTVLVDVSLKSMDTDNFGAGDGISDCDNAAYEYFHSLHEGEVTDHNLEEEQIKAEIEEAGGSYTMNTWTAVEIEEIWDHVNREFWLQTVSLPDNKMQLLGTMVYEMDDGLVFPDEVSRRFELPIYISGEYDTASSTVPTPRHLNQIYVLYSDPTKEPVALRGKDIRILDAGDVLDANIFLVKQDASSMDVDDAAAIPLLSNRQASEQILVSMVNPLNSYQEAPARVDLYCSGNVELENEGSIGTATCHDYTLVPKKTDEVRVATVTFEILDKDTGDILAAKTVTRLQ